MATYSQWAKSRKITRVAWVCGPEETLRRDVLEAYSAAAGSAQRFLLWPGGGPWDTLLAVPSGPRLAIVSEAEKLTARDRVPLLLGDEFDGAFVVFLSAEDDFTKDTVRHQPSGQQRAALSSYLGALRDSRHGQLVRCCAPADEEGKAALVAAWWPGAGRNTGAALLERCSGSIAEARAAVTKAVLAGLAPCAESLDYVCPPQASDDFAGQLVAGKVKAAMAAAALVRPDEAGGALALLSSRLTVLALLGEAARKGADVRETSQRLKIDPYVYRLLRPYAAFYPPERVARCRQALALAESSWKSGARDGILEAVAALWQ